jgi:hypothetical protein
MGWGATFGMIERGRRQFAVVLSWLLIVVALTGCAGGGSPAVAPGSTVVGPTATTGPNPATPPTAAERRVCDDGRLAVGDLDEINAGWVEGVEQAFERARQWQPDARLESLRVTCGVLENDFRWQGTFYSERLQVFFSSDTGSTEPAEIDPALIPELPTGGLDFVGLQVAVSRAGFADDAELTSQGIEIRINTEAAPFGPPSAPKSVVYYHLGLRDEGGVRDLFVSADTWVIWTYQ